MSRRHPYHRLRVPIDAPFELKPAAEKGWGAFATRPVAQGAVILREEPLFFIPKPHEEITELDLWAAFQHMAPRDKEQFMHIRDNSSRPFTCMTNLFAENSFVLENPTGHGLFLFHSRINHSCIPNCKIPELNSRTSTSSNRAITSFAARDIAYGEELTFCYNSNFHCRTREDRHRALRFVCHCKACTAGTSFQQLSDMRGTLVRGLQYLLLGVDIDGQKDTSQNLLIVDPDLKRASENQSIPISAWLIYHLLIMVLLEQEGLADEFMVEKLSPEIMLLPDLFSAAHNANLAKLALTQKTWLGMFCIAFQLFGREDAADSVLAVLLRTQRGLPQS